MGNLHIAGLRKTFGTTQVLKGVSLDIAEGEFVALLGPSGCGKTTLLRTVAGLESQDSGSIHIAGRQVDDLGPAERDVALVFQSYALYPHLTVGQNIALPLTMRRLTAVERLAGVSRLWPSVRTRRATITADVTAIARSMEIDHLLERKPAQLSGGQKQRVAVARALVRKPSLLLMDEPLSNLDAKLRVQMRREIVDMHRRHRATTVYVTHDQTEAMTMADRIAVIFDGELQQIDTPAVIYRSPATLAVAEFVGSPKINIVPCTPVDGGIECLGQHLAGTLTGSGRAGFVGLRAEHLGLRHRGAGAIDCRVLNLEYLGADVLVIVALGHDEQLCLRMDAQAFEALGAHDALAVGLHTQHLLVFDTNGQRLRWTPTPAA